MKRMFRGLALAVGVMVGLAAMPIRAAEETGAMKVDDKAGLFSAEGVAKAKSAFEGTTFLSKTHLYVYSVGGIPEGKRAEFDAAKKDADSRKHFFATWAKELAKSKDRKGDVFVLLYHTEKNYFASAVSDEQSDVHRHMSDKKLAEVAGIFTRALKSNFDQKHAGDEAKKEMNAALASATEVLILELKDTSAPEAGHKKASANHVAAEKKGGGLGSYICMFVAIGLGIWLVIGLIRAFTGGGGGGGGYGGGGGGYGGGGGGFMTSLMGGMFGAMAGMWMYNNLMGGHDYQNDAMAGDNYGSDGATDTGDGNYDGGGQAGDGGGDWGDSGGDAGGGDWGGDAGGGGDWGGGGGDFGGGGGDW